MVLVEQDADLVLVNYVTCRLSFWIDVELARREVMATKRSRLEYVLKASDYGLVDEGGDGDEAARIEIELDLVQSGLEKEGSPRVVELDADMIRKNDEAVVEFEFGGELELVSIGKLVYSEIDAKIKTVDYR